FRRGSIHAMISTQARKTRRLSSKMKSIARIQFVRLAMKTGFLLTALFFVMAQAFCANDTNYYNSGNAKAQIGDLDGAIADYSLAIGINSNYSKAYNNRGLAKQGSGDLD